MRMTQYLTATVALVLTLASSQMSQAQGLFSPAITVNDSVITNYEIAQRRKLLEIFRTPGNLDELAREGLIEDRLKQEELARAGLRLSDEGLAIAMEEFAGRANMSLEQFLTVLAQNGVEDVTLRDFVKIGISWRDFVRSRFGSQTEVTEAEIDRAINQRSGSTTAIEVLLSEIIIPAPPPQAARAMATANRIAQLTSTSAFSAEARRVSALPSRTNGGRLSWLPLNNYPPQLRNIILNLATGEVTAPISITNGVALFQMRGVREVPATATAPSAIEYAAYYIAGGRSDAGLRAAQSLTSRIDTCDDLYGEAQGQPVEVLDRNTLPPAEIPQDIAIELARLDPGEVSYNLTRSDGQTLVFLMLCNREAEGAADIDRDAVRNQLLSQRLAGYANGLLADLRAAATITQQ